MNIIASQHNAVQRGILYRAIAHIHNNVNIRVNNLICIYRLDVSYIQPCVRFKPKPNQELLRIDVLQRHMIAISSCLRIKMGTGQMVTKKDITKFLQELDYKDLIALSAQCQELIVERQATARNEAKQKLQEQAEQLGFSLSELFPTSTRARSSGERAPAAIKYRNPKNHSETWTGRGRTPRWITREISSGHAKKADEFLIK